MPGRDSTNSAQIEPRFIQSSLTILLTKIVSIIIMRRFIFTQRPSTSALFRSCAVTCINEVLTLSKGNKKSFQQAIAQIKVVRVNFTKLYTFHFSMCRKISLRVQVNMILTIKSVGNFSSKVQVNVDHTLQKRNCYFNTKKFVT